MRMWIRILPFTLLRMQIRIRILASKERLKKNILACHLQIDADLDPDPACHFDANLDPDPTLQFDADPSGT
jgi:hypothetical protein